MDKDQLINDFFRALRVTLTNAFSYSKDHPYFVKSVESFKLKLEEVLAVLSPFKIGVTSLGLVVDGKDLTRIGFYDELARLLHQRKIKSIEIRRGATLAELVGFFSVISMAQKDIFKKGGVNLLLDKEQVVNFIVEELDYSAFLQGDGQDCVDIWGFMLKEAAQSEDEDKLNKLADNFGALIKRTTQNDVFESEEISSSINEFLVCLKEKNKEKFDKCAKEVFLWLLHNRSVLNDERLAKLKPVFNGLNQDDFTALLWEGLSQEDNFDTLSLQLFSKISEQKNPPKITEGFSSRINALQNLSGNPRVTKRIQNLLVETQDGQLSAVYRHTLESLIKGISSSGELFFDQKALKDNYRYVVLNIFAIEEEGDNLLLAAEVLEKELAQAFTDNDLDFLKDLYSQLVKKNKQGNSVSLDLEKKFSAFIESIILGQSLLPQQECFLQMVSSPSQEANFYLDRIFTGEKVNPQVLSLFFKFFPGNLDIFYQRVEQKLSDLEFIFSLIETLGQQSTPVTLGILDHIYSSANELMKIEILNIMRKLKKVDVEFLMRQLNTNSPSLRKNILSVLILNPQAQEGALDFLFKVPSFCGLKNGLLIENLQIVFNLGITQAASRIQGLAGKRFFWNRKLRKVAQKILKEWNAR
ncbi:MAG: hypothetical protein V1830_03655 [Candidatus Omnitrophota bacterium]